MEPMIAEMNGLMQSVRVVTDLVKANHTLRNFNELVTAIYQVNAKLLTVQSVALESQEKQATFAQRISDLEKEIMELKNWDREAQRYQLVMVALGTFAYVPKPGMENGEPTHYLCTNCFPKGEKSILQADSVGAQVYTYGCPRCQSKVRVATPPATVPLIRG
jgi:Zn finger protein HypA/HybF involved in hydrogenase expression